MPIERRELERLLLALGFQVDESDHRRFILYHNGKPLIRTMLSRGSGHRTVGEDVVAQIARQLQISRGFLYELVRGTKKRQDYLIRLRDLGLLG